MRASTSSRAEIFFSRIMRVIATTEAKVNSGGCAGAAAQANAAATSSRRVILIAPAFATLPCWIRSAPPRRERHVRSRACQRFGRRSEGREALSRLARQQQASPSCCMDSYKTGYPHHSFREPEVRQTAAQDRQSGRSLPKMPAWRSGTDRVVQPSEQSRLPDEPARWDATRSAGYHSVPASAEP